MQIFLDFLPVILFFIAYKIFGIYIATAVAMLASIIMLAVSWYKHRRIEPTKLIACIVIITLGGATLLSRNPMFIKWKPTVVSWCSALFFFGSQFIGKKPLIQYMMDGKVELPTKVWLALNRSWGIFFTIIGAVNLYVVYSFSTEIWVHFKIFGFLGSTVLFAIGQSMYMAKFIQNNTPDNKNT